MGWKGTVRSVGAAVRAADREAKRREREAIRRQNKFEKLEAQAEAMREATNYATYINNLVSIHQDCREQIDWRGIADNPAPSEPTKDSKLETLAREKMENYRPGAISKIFGNEAKKREKLRSAVQDAAKEDGLNFHKAQEEWRKAFSDWKESTALANALVANDADAKIQIINELGEFSTIDLLGKELNFTAEKGKLLEAKLTPHDEDIVPKETRTLLQSGRLSVKQTPKGKYYELYQDHVCSAMLRVARELLALLPDEKVVITALASLLNTSTGHKEEVPIISACISRSTLEGLNFVALDPSDALSQFVHNMDFKKTKGFAAVESIDPTRFADQQMRD